MAKQVKQNSDDSSERLSPPSQLAELTEANKRLKRKIFDLYTIFEISKHLNSVLNTETLLDGIILTCIGQMGVNGAAIFIVRSHENDDLTLAKFKGLAVEPKARMLIKEDSPILRLIQSMHGKPLSYEEIRNRLGDISEVKVLRTLECEYLIPMSLQNRVRGLLSVTRKISGTEFFEDDLEFLAILANQLSVAVENARLFDSEKEALEQLRAAQLQLMQAEKLAALGQLSARVAHEVNNPLGIIKNYLLMIRELESRDKQSSEYVQIVTEEVDRIARIVRQLLDMFKPSHEGFSETDVESVIDETLLLLSLHAQRGKVTIKKQLPSPLPHVYGSSEQLKQVFLNLMINSCDFMPAGGKIEIRGEVEDHQMRLYFTDWGPGIAAENFEKIWEPFFTTKSAGKGTGLGLSVCYSIIKAHNGVITAGNAKGAGARFTITLPTKS
ncbi:MAG: ATP-binding protein [Candidatus Zixiibacteriota bacterium]